MTIQKPYNSGNETFWIWNPPRQRVQRRFVFLNFRKYWFLDMKRRCPTCLIRISPVLITPVFFYLLISMRRTFSEKLYDRVKDFGSRDISLHSSVWNVPRQGVSKYILPLFNLILSTIRSISRSFPNRATQDSVAEICIQPFRG